MEMKDIKKEVRQEILGTVERGERLSRSAIQKEAYVICEGIERREKKIISPEVKEEVVRAICEDFLGFGPLQQLIEDDQVTGLMVNGPFRCMWKKEGRKPCRMLGYVCFPNLLEFYDSLHTRKLSTLYLAAGITSDRATLVSPLLSRASES